MDHHTTSPKRGRDYFNAARPLIACLELVLGALPRRFSEACLLVFRHVPTYVGIGARYLFIRRLAKHCGEYVAIFEGAYVFSSNHLEIGDHVSIHQLCYIDASGGLLIGSNVSIAHGCTIITTNHSFNASDNLIREAQVTREPVRIGSDIWIGAGVRIMPGVTIGDRVVIGAGSVVTKDIPSGSLAVGVPARVIRELQ